MDLRQTYNRIAEDWFRDHIKDDWWTAGTDKFITFLPKGGRVLDVGCGGGTKSRYLNDRGLKVTGIDFSADLLAIAKREAPGAHFQLLDLRQIDQLTEKFDGVFLQAVLLHFPETEIVPILKKVIQVINPGGYIYVAVKEQRSGGAAEEVKVERDYGYEYQRYFSYFTPDQVRSWFAAIGCSLVFEDQRKFDNTTWIQVIGKIMTEASGNQSHE